MPKIDWLPNPDRGTAISVGFDGSENNDFTAIRCETRDGLQFTPRYGPDRRPTIWDPAQWGGQIPRAEVHAAVDEIFSTWQVSRMYCDPQDWYSEIGDWALEHGEEHVFEWATNRVRQMYDAIRRFETDLATGRIRHDGCPITAVHIANARKVAKPGQKYILGKPADHQKIDAAMASILAHEAAADARESGWEDDVDSRMFCFG
ncbi:terminase TerL endonuclease subunit [Rhodococcus sp. AH-ZY2]|uniref:terminase TerL endonuclease subunit n=1 Tax=Rhodococcus sp. AH-ZY2 TaxID=3047468 RepID=UPI0027DFE08F|nr:terminase TerL endonuclease subunit [Rhodococcus sp. AH-ZY2]WML63647.1 terminase large subunit [Rhodococcus sp. AH-ZY2]